MSSAAMDENSKQSRSQRQSEATDGFIEGSPRIYPNLSSEINKYQQQEEEASFHQDNLGVSSSSSSRNSDRSRSSSPKPRHRRHTPATASRKSRPSESDTDESFCGEESSRKIPPAQNRGSDWSIWVKDNLLPIIVILSLCLLLILLLIYAFWSRAPPPKSFALFKEELVEMQKRFPQKNGKIWTQLRASAKSVLNQSAPSQPAVVLLAGTDPNTVTRFAKYLARSFASAYHQPSFAAFDCSISSNLAEYLERELHHVALIGNIDSTGAEGALALHTYCDNKNAPIKDAAIVLTIQKSLVEWPGEDCGKRVEDWLREVWSGKGLNLDSIGAVLSRVANSVICLEAVDY